MIFRWPWAKRKHYHPDLTLTKYATCAGCRHLILVGHVENKEVEVFDRSKGTTISHIELYGKSCAPGYDRKEIALDGKIRFYKDGKELIN